MNKLPLIDWLPERRLTIAGVGVTISGAVNHARRQPFGIVQVFVDGHLLKPIYTEPDRAVVATAMDHVEANAAAGKYPEP